MIRFPIIHMFSLLILHSFIDSHTLTWLYQEGVVKSSAINTRSHQLWQLYFLVSSIIGNYSCECLCVCSVASVMSLWDPIDCCWPGASVHGISQARIQEWVAMPFSRGSSHLSNRTCVSCLANGFFITEPPGKSYVSA